MPRLRRYQMCIRDRFASLEQPIDSAPLRQRVRPGDRVALVISDMTRFWMRQDLVIPHLVDYLIDECGVQPEHLTIVVANGTHLSLIHI